MKRGRALLFIAAVSCTRQDARETNVPADVAYAAILSVDDAGVLVKSTPLIAWTAGQPLPVFAAAEGKVLVVAWTQEQLDAGGTRSLTGATLRAADASACAPRLPEPRWVAEIDAEGAVKAAAASELPRLVSADISICPSAPKIDATFSCSDGCAPVRTALGDCRFALDFSGCGLGRAEVIVLGDGSTCLAESESDDWSCEQAAPIGVYGTGTCSTPAGRCEVTIGIVPDPPPFVIDEITFLDVPEFSPHVLRDFGGIEPQTLKAGYAFDMVTYEREILVSVTGTTATEGCFKDSPGPGRLLRIDLETQRVVGDSAVPSCLAELRSDPEQNGFLGAYVDAGNMHVGRFQRDGTLLHSEALVPSDGSTIDLGRAYVVNVDILGPQFYVFVGGVLGEFDRVHVFSQMTLAPIFDQRLPKMEMSSGTRLNAQTILFGGSAPVSLTWFDVTRSSIDDMIVLGDQLAAGHGVYGLATTNARIYAMVSPPNRILVGDIAGTFMPAIHVPIGVPTRAALFPPTPSTAPESARLVFASRPGNRPGEVEASVMRLDLTRLRLLPGAWRVGHGVVTTFQYDTQNRLYALLPWSGKIARITQRP